MSLDPLPPLARAQGHSLVPLLTGVDAAASEYQFIEFNGEVDGGVKMRAVVSAVHKYVWCPGYGDQLFDLADDPDELKNRTDDPALAGVKTRLIQALSDWMKRTGDFLKYV